MNSSSKSRRLVVIIIILLITNIGILAFFLWPRDKDPKNPGSNGYGMTETLRREVGLDSNQVSEFRRLRQEHWKKMKPLFEDLQNTKNNFYALLRNPETPDSVVAKAATSIGDKQRAIDLQVYHHFKTSRQVCTPAQYEKYDSLVQVVIRKMSGPSFNNNNNNKGKREEPNRK